MDRFEIADWWDANHKRATTILQGWVNTSRSGIGLHSRAFAATIVETSMVLGAGMVDLLRIGEGVRRGGWGYARDGIRLLSFAGPFLRLGRLGWARLTTDPGGPLCASVAAAKALRHSGTSVFARAEDVARMLGAPPKNIDQLIPVLRRFGAKCIPASISNFETLKAVVAQNPRSVVLFGVRWVHPTKGLVGHALYAYRNLAGRVIIVDRTGASVSSLAELGKAGYAGIEAATFAKEVVILRNAILVEGTTLMSQLALEVNVVLTNNQDGNRANLVPVSE